MGKKKVVVLMFSALSSALVGSGIYDAYADDSRPLPLVEGVLDSAQDALIPPGEIRKAPKRKEHSVPETPETPLEQPDLMTEDDPVPSSQKDEKSGEPGPVSPAPKAVQSEPVISPVPVPDPKPTPEKESEPKSQPKAKTEHEIHKDSVSESSSDTSGKDSITAAGTGGKAESAGKFDGKSRSVNSGADGEVKGEKMAKTGFSPLPLVQIIGGLFGLGGAALYGMRRKSDG
ncbi:hypothetical protein CLV97_110102 [Planifilum fimeticola]|uniref:LPXTG-motif cell wall-anchored protein n=1 Tax=Planifilum fimeticola TaxID=201975 RepID=A0A2T0LFD4_9BACL|nr:hypothetical protein CLV97_110102 [Planifilum fimeticola]